MSIYIVNETSISYGLQNSSSLPSAVATYLAELWKLTFTTVMYYLFCPRLLIISSYGFKRLSSVPRYYEIRKLRLVVTSDWIGVVIVIRSVEYYDLVKTAFLCGLWLRRLCCSKTRFSKSQGEAEELNRLQRVQKWFWFFFFAPASDADKGVFSRVQAIEW